MGKAKHRNGVRHSLWVKEKTVVLRQEGKTHREIVKELGISLGSADFKVGNFLIEYFGLAGEMESYDQLIQKKRILARDKRMNLIEIYPKDLFFKGF